MRQHAAAIAASLGIATAVLIALFGLRAPPWPSPQTLFYLALLAAVLTCVVGLVTGRERMAIVGGVVAAVLIWWASQ